MSAKFVLGDIVSLISGGPDMTVVGTPDADQVKCMWFPKQDGEWARAPYTADFHRVAIVLERPNNGKSAD